MKSCSTLTYFKRRYKRGKQGKVKPRSLWSNVLLKFHVEILITVYTFWLDAKGEYSNVIGQSSVKIWLIMNK